MKTLNTLIVLALLLVAQTAISQRTYDIRFVLDDIDCTENTVCYRTELRSADGQTWNLAGQNYRLFYAGSIAEYIDDSATSLLPDSQYLLDQSGIQDAQHVDARDFGFNLSFAEDLSFLNYSIDLMSLGSGGMMLPGDGQWVETSRLCFDVPPEAMTDPNLCLEIVWARMGRTDDYATAFVEVSQWVQTNSTTDALTNIYDDLDSQDTEGACLAAECDPDVIIENTLEACTDGLDNDGDGLVDCQEEMCSVFCPDEGTPYDISMDLSSIDCTNGATCYAISLKSATDNEFTLGSQEYGIFYNSALGTYLSGSSMLSDQYLPYTLQGGTPIENRNASGLGDLSYEDDLGYLRFSMQLNDNSAGGDQIINATTFTQVAEICFTIGAEAINNEMVCFEANFAQDGLTDSYDTDLLSIEEWKAADDIVSATPVMFNNIDADRGDDACFDMTCEDVEQEAGALCEDGLDNDNDGLIDCSDPSCSAYPGCDLCLADAPEVSGIGSTITQCDFLTGPVAITTSGGNNNAGYITQYVLTNANGEILLVQNSSNFEIREEGFYNVYAVNFRSTDTPAGLAIGEDIDSISGSCFDLSESYVFTVCQEIDPCNYCLGEIVEFEPEDNNSTTGFTTQYVLTNKQGEILRILDDPIVDSLSAGLYLLFPINYDPSEEITGLTIGQNISGIQSCCKDIGDAYVIGVCDQLKPTIFYDLQGCDITQNAVIVVGGVYDSYLWSTGSTEDFITVSATDPANYRVTVTLENGCIGIGSQSITGNEVSSIGDYVWEDSTPNGRQDPTESGLNNVTVRLYADFDRNGVPDIPNFASCTTVTGNHPTTGQPGYYNFNVYISNYVIEFVSPPGYVAADQNKGDDAGDSDINESGFTPTIGIGSGQVIDNIDAGFRTSSAICGSVWEDVDSDGRREAEDEGLNDIIINLYTAAGVLYSSTVSVDSMGAPGFYCFEELPVQDYYVEVVLPDSAVLTIPNIGNDARDSEGTNANGLNTTNIISTNSGQTSEGVDFGYYTGGTICGIVFQDLLGGTDGVYDEGIDSVIANSFVTIIDSETNDTVSVAATNADGSYCATNIPVGSYQACFGVSGDRDSYVQLNSGDDPLLDSDVNTSSGKTEVMFVPSGGLVEGVNAGIKMGTLPIELLSFTGRHDKFSSSNFLEWATAIEINNDRFEVERLINLDGEFKKIGMVEGAGTSNLINRYEFKDKDASMPGNYYYRLRQVDYDEGYEYSKIIALKVGSEKSLLSDSKLRVFPNPASGLVQVLVKVDENYTNSTLILTDVMGRIHRTWNNVELNSGDNIIQLHLSNVNPGNYILQHNDGNNILHERIQIIR